LRRIVLVVVGILAAVLAVTVFTAGFWVNWLWFGSIGLNSVLLTRYIAQGTLFLGGALIAGLFFGLNLRHASRQLLGTPVNIQGQQVMLAPRIFALATLVGGVMIGFLFGSGAASNWSVALQFLNRTQFGITEPIYNRDVAFYVFTLPLLDAVRSWLLGLFIVTLVAVSALAFLRFSSGVAQRQFNLPRDVRGHLSLLGALILGCFSFSYWLANFGLLYSERGFVSGAGRTDLFAQRPANYILLALSALAALLLLWNIFARRVRPLLITVGVWAFAAVVVGLLFPAAYQNFFVRPSEFRQERPYIENNIRLTRQAYALDQIQVGQLKGDAPIEASTIAANEAAINDIRLWDYRPLLTTYRQIQRFGQYYDFEDIDIDRYRLDNGPPTQTMLSARELDITQLDQRAQTWQNRHLVYTHGYGVVVNPANRFTSQGQPELLVRNIPPVGEGVLQLTRPQIYYGELTNEYAIVNTREREFDRPGTGGGTEEYANYVGDGGVSIGSFFNRLLFASALGDTNILFSSSLRGESRILYNRVITDRVQAVAPFLMLDEDPYMVILDGKLLWVQDTYTVTNRFPYSTATATPAGEVNYIRNSVKVTIDAYTGEMRFYAVDERDPLLQTYQKIYPSLFTPMSAAPTGLIEHFRYPVDLFDIQADRYLRYHMTDPQSFYNQGDLWAVARETYADKVQRMESYYVTIRLPGETQEEFALILPFTPAGQNRDNMVSWMAARSDGANYGKLQVYTFPQGTLVYGPQQIEARINQEPEITQVLTLLNQRGSSVIRGNLLVIPFGDALLYVQPLFLQATNGGLPELERIIVTTSNPNQGVIMSDRLDTALTALAQNRKGIALSQPGATPVPSTPPASGGATGSQAELAAQALDRYNRAQEALKNGDWATYGNELAELEKILQQIAGR
jgi:uncharacterized membrane protein (UPF0182 family)